MDLKEIGRLIVGRIILKWILNWKTYSWENNIKMELQQMSVSMWNGSNDGVF
jgi:hypothetical protein